MGRREWSSTWAELGAKHVGVIQSLLTTCRLHEISPYDYLVDVLQRNDRHPASRVVELTPRLWKKHFPVLRVRRTSTSNLALAQGRHIVTGYAFSAGTHEMQTVINEF